MSSSQANIIHYIEPADENETEFDYFIVNKNRALNAKVDNFQHPNAECEDLKNKQIQPGGSPTRSHCKRDPTQPITITTSIDKPGYPLDPVRMPAGYPRISCDPIAIQSRAHPGCITYNFDPNDLYGPLTAAGRNPNVAIRVTNKCAETVTVYGALQGTNGAGIAEKNEIVSPGKEFTIAALGGGGKAYAAVARRCNVSCSNITFMHDGTPITKCSTNPRLP